MADSGYSYDTLVTSLSAVGSASGALISLSLTGKDNKVIPLIDYGDFSQHIFFTDAVRLFNTSLDRIIGEYPIGASGTDTDSLCAENIFKVDEFKKKSSGFDLWLLILVVFENRASPHNGTCPQCNDPDVHQSLDCR